MYDAIIVGGGPAGLNAALVLGRAQRRILLCDSGEPRNRQVHHTHGFLSRDGIGPAELRTIDALAARWGISAFNCPYCDGWEVRDQPLAVFGTDEANIRLALTLTRYSPDVTLCTNGAAEPDAEAA